MSCMQIPELDQLFPQQKKHFLCVKKCPIVIMLLFCVNTGEWTVFTVFTQESSFLEFNFQCEKISQTKKKLNPEGFHVTFRWDL